MAQVRRAARARRAPAAEVHLLLSEDLDWSRLSPAGRRVKFSVIVAAYNEGPQIGSSLKRLRQVSQTSPMEVIVIDGGSDDGTLEAARRGPTRSRTSANRTAARSGTRARRRRRATCSFSFARRCPAAGELAAGARALLACRCDGWPGRHRVLGRVRRGRGALHFGDVVQRACALGPGLLRSRHLHDARNLQGRRRLPRVPGSRGYGIFAAPGRARAHRAAAGAPPSGGPACALERPFSYVARRLWLETRFKLGATPEELFAAVPNL